MPRTRPKKEDYEPVASVPEGLTWKPGPGVTTNVMLYSIGNIYKLVRDRVTGAVQYFKLKDTGPEKSPNEKIDAEPAREAQVRYRVGTMCWFIDEGSHWFLCEVVERTGKDRATFGEPQRITIKSVNGRDADKQVEWPYGLLEFPAKENNPIFARLRPLKARYR